MPSSNPLRHCTQVPHRHARKPKRKTYTHKNKYCLQCPHPFPLLFLSCTLISSSLAFPVPSHSLDHLFGVPHQTMLTTVTALTRSQWLQPAGAATCLLILCSQCCGLGSGSCYPIFQLGKGEVNNFPAGHRTGK